MRKDVLRVVRFELRRMLRDSYLWIGVAGFVLVAAVGAYFYWQSAPPRPTGGRLFSEAYLLALIAAYHCGLARDRLSGFDRYQVANFTPPAALYAGHLLSTVVFLTGFALFGFLLALVLALGDVGYATEYAFRLYYLSLIMLPFVVLHELALSSRLPVPILLVTFFLVGLVYSRIGNANDVADLMGMDAAPLGAVLRVLVALALAAACYPLFLKRLGRVSLASS